MAYRQKECCVLILDTGLSGPSLAFPKEPSKFEVARKCADFYLRRFLQEQRKTDQVGIVALLESGCEEVYPIQPAHLNHRKALAALQCFDAAAAQGGNEMLSDAIEFAAEQMAKCTKHNKYKRTLVLFTDGAACAGEERGKAALKRAKHLFRDFPDVEWEVFGIDFGFAGRERAEQVEGEANLLAVFGQDAIRPIAQADDMFHLTKRHVGQVKKWRGELTVSEQVKFHCIMVARIAEDKVKSLVKRSKLVLEEDMNGDAEAFLSGEGGEEGLVKMDRKYMSSEDLDRELQPEERSRAFRYGKDLLPMFPADEESMRLEDRASCLKVIGIIPRAELKRTYMISPTNCIVADPGSVNSQQGFSAFCLALRDLDKVCTARFVQKDGRNPKLVALIPGQTPSAAEGGGEIDCLWHVQMPTMEDIRDYSFERCITFAQRKPAEDEATVQYVNAMTFGRNDAVRTHQFDPEHTFNPYIARYWDAVHDKAMSEDAYSVQSTVQPPPASELVSSMICVDPVMQKRSLRAARNFKRVFGLNRLEKKKPALAPIDISKFGAETNAAVAESGKETEQGDDDAWFENEEKILVEFVGNISPVEDFWALMGREGREKDALQQLQHVVLDMVGPTTGDPIYYEKAISCLKALREGCIKCDKPTRFNDFMTGLKDGLLFESQESPFWRRMAEEQIELIAPNASEVSLKFYSSSESTTQTILTPGSSQAKIFEEEQLFEEME